MFVKKSLCYMLLLCILIPTVFYNPIISYAKEKTGEQMVAEIINELDLSDVSYFNKVIICGNWIAENISYDYKGLQNGTENRKLQETMKERKGVCEGYARVFKEFMDQIGVPCLYISDSKMDHAYNIVLMNDYKWYLVEPQVSLLASWEQDLYNDCINEWVEYINDTKSEVNEAYYEEHYKEIYDSFIEYKESVYNSTIPEFEEELRVYEEKLKLLDGRGELMFENAPDRNSFLNGTTDFENNTIAPGSGYYEFVKLADSKVHGYPVAATKLRTDPDKEQKQFINKSDITFTKSNISINAATCKTDVKLPLSLKNYTTSDLKFDINKFFTVDLNKKKETARYSHYPDLFRKLLSSSVDTNLNLIAHQGKSSLSFQLIATTIYGNQTSATITIKYPQLTQKTSNLLYDGIKVGTKIKLSFTESADIKDFDIYIDKTSLKYIEYISKTGEIKGKKSGVATLWIKSKTNNNYTLSYTVIVK